MAKKKTKSKKRRGRGATTVQRSGSGPFCVTATRPKNPGSGKAGGLVFQTVCYTSQDAALKSLPNRTKNAYSVMLYKRRGSKLKAS